MKALKKNELAGGLVALLAVVVLGLFSLTGCSNASGGTSKADGPNQFLGEWIYEQTTSQSGVELTQTCTWNFKSNGICTYTVSMRASVPGASNSVGTTYEYTAKGDTATLNYNGATITITLRPDGKSFLYGGKSYTKQQQENGVKDKDNKFNF